MTRKDYEKIAAVIGNVTITAAKDRFDVYQQGDMTALALADLFAAENENFDRVRFLKAFYNYEEE